MSDYRVLLGQIQELLPDPNKLHVLAQWFDLQDAETGSQERGVQDDLRRWARNADRAADLIKEVI